MIVLNLPFPPSTNNLFVNGLRGRFPSQKYADWITEAGWELTRQRPAKVAGQVNLIFEFQEGRDKRKRDVTNLIKAPEDLLVKHGVIEADDGSIVRKVEASWNAEVEGVRITIHPVTTGEPPNEPTQYRR